MKLVRRTFVASLVTLTASPILAQDCAEGERAFDHAGGTTCIPQDPQRIVSLWDQSITLPLLEYGAPVVGSHGRNNLDEPFMRSVDIHLGITFENSDIVYVGSWESMDYEAIAALQPDLIIGREWEMEARDQYEAIAPTIFIADDPDEPLNFSYDLADAVGRLDEWNRLKAAYDANIARVREAMPELEDATYSILRISSGGDFMVFAGFGGLTQILGDLGMNRIPLAQDMADRGVAWGAAVSIELLPELQADYIFDTYTLDDGGDAFTQQQRLSDAIPSWCEVLTACAEGRYIVFPQEVATELNFSQLNTTIFLVETHLARNYVTE